MNPKATPTSNAAPARYYGGERAYLCNLCDHDSGYVLIWNPFFIAWFLHQYTDNGLEVPSDWATRQEFDRLKAGRPRTRKGPVSFRDTCAVVCNCSQRREHAGQRGEVMFNEDKHCPFRQGDLRNVIGWLESRSDRHAEFDQFNVEPSFA